jgi:hypothetical protein
MIDACVPAALQDVEEPDYIRVDVWVWLAERATHTGLRGEMNEVGRMVSGKECIDRIPIRKVYALRQKPFCGCEKGKTRLLELRVIVWREAVDADDVESARQQPPGNVKSHKARSTGYDDRPPISADRHGRARSRLETILVRILRRATVSPCGVPWLPVV